MKKLLVGALVVSMLVTVGGVGGSRARAMDDPWWTCFVYVWRDGCWWISDDLRQRHIDGVKAPVKPGPGAPCPPPSTGSRPGTGPGSGDVPR